MRPTAAARHWPQPLWADTAPATPPHPALSGSHAADVTIIGAGFTGLRAALKLADAGLRVVVLDAGDVGFGASGRTGGQVNPLLPFNTPTRLRKLLGPVHFERLTETALNSADELFALIETWQIDCQPRQNGWLRVCHSDRAFRAALEGVTEWNRHGAAMQPVEGDEVQRLSGSPAYRRGVVAPKGGAVQPMALARGLARAAEGRGAAIHGDSTVTGLRRDGAHWVATTPAGEVRSDWVVIATNGYTDDLIPRLATSIIPVTPIQIATAPLPAETAETILPGGHTISDSRRIIMYARREPDRRMVYGGHGKLDRNGNLSGFDWLKADAERVFPQLKGANWTHRWGGRIALTEDHLPHLHEPQPGLLVGLGYNGRGVAMSNVMGRVLAERVLGADPAALPFPVSPIRDVPFRRLQLTGMGTAIWFLRLLDYLETR